MLNSIVSVGFEKLDSENFGREEDEVRWAMESACSLISWIRLQPHSFTQAYVEGNMSKLLLHIHMLSSCKQAGDDDAIWFLEFDYTLIPSHKHVLKEIWQSYHYIYTHLAHVRNLACIARVQFKIPYVMTNGTILIYNLVLISVVYYKCLVAKMNNEQNWNSSLQPSFHWSSLIAMTVSILLSIFCNNP